MRRLIPLMAALVVLGAFAGSAIAKPGPVPLATVGTNPKMNTLNADQVIDSTGGFSSGPSLSLTTGTYIVTAGVSVSDEVLCRISDGSTVVSFDAAKGSNAASGLVIVTAATATVRVQCKYVGGYSTGGGYDVRMYAKLPDGTVGGIGNASYLVAYQTGP